ncbi:MAG TPA: zf-HC2 domain-containing protein [Actinocrinis sp.]|jgi:anti-sigma factor RsiW|uniref:anti-sigma factor family protein n=1 Tax=Actinocrinis sp. TaxID=1920516 RepID=UPI002DDCEE26|nr:zf-HC2 domain-containing protein [Actinocrinis sp.]HEV3173476.1 zf-HC2 domain-containing protein [Actinocrinis sp.]
MVRFNEHLGARLGALVDGELAHDDRDRALAHLAGCVQCRTLVESERALKEQLGAMPMPEPSARLMAALFQIPQTEAPPPPPQDGPPQIGGFLGRSSAFLPEFAVGLRPIGDLPDDPSLGGDDPSMNRVRASRGRAFSSADSAFLSLGRGLPTIR